MEAINKSTIHEALNTGLLSQKYFESFKWVKSKSMLKSQNKTSKIDRTIKFELYETVPHAESDDLGFELTVIIGVRFNILYKWFEKYYKGSTIKDLRTNSTFIIIMSLHNEHQVFFFRNGIDFDAEIDKTVACITEKSTVFYDVHRSLEQVYDTKIAPFLTGEMKTTAISNWFHVFEYLTICKIIAPQNFDKLDVILYAHFKYLHERKEPNVIKYFSIYREAVDELKEIELG